MTVIFLMSINVLMCQYITSEGGGREQMLPSKGSAELSIFCFVSFQDVLVLYFLISAV